MDSWWRIKILARFWSATVDQKEIYQINILCILILWENDSESFKENGKRRATEFGQYGVSLIPVLRLLLWNSRMDKKSPTEVSYQQDRTIEWRCGWLEKKSPKKTTCHSWLDLLVFLPARRHCEHPLSLHMSQWGSNGIWTWESVFVVVTAYEKNIERSHRKENEL